ncbi:MAG: hypothetical protein RLY97_1207 [Pseudomonadota bacterium]|jgi:hypothetical protein
MTFVFWFCWLVVGDGLPRRFAPRNDGGRCHPRFAAVPLPQRAGGGFSDSLQNLEQPCRAHAAADAHGDDDIFDAAPLAFD